MLSEKDLKEWFSGLTREKILIDNHARRRSRLRVFSEENIYSLLIEHPFKKIIKNKEDTNVPKFEVHYNHPHKKDENIVIIFMPYNINEKIIKIVTVIIE